MPALSQAGTALPCDSGPEPEAAGFPDQPINIFIPRSSASGSLGLPAQIASAIEGLSDARGRPLGIRVALHFKYGGSLAAALDYFGALPPNGYNVIALNDTYASALARPGASDPGLIPLGISQILFSQIFVRRGDPELTTLDGFLARARAPGTMALRIAKFGEDGAERGLEDFLLDRFIRQYRLPGAEATPAHRSQGTPDTLRLLPVGFESGAERYFSLFDRSAKATRRTDALIEQPGDVGSLISGGLITPIFTLLPEDKVPALLRQRMGVAAAFPPGPQPACDATYRFRGFFVSAGIPEDRRAWLEWVFLRAFDTETMQAYNHLHYADLLYSDPAIMAAYCDPKAAAAFFRQSVADYRTCFQNDDSGPAAEAGP